MIILGYISFTQFYPWVKPTLLPTFTQFYPTGFTQWVKRTMPTLVRVTCDVGYLCANFSLPRPVCSRVMCDVRDTQTDVRQKHRLMPPPYGIWIWIIVARSRRLSQRRVVALYGRAESRHLKDGGIVTNIEVFTGRMP